MQRRSFLKSVVVGTTARLCKGDERLTFPKTRTALDPTAVARELAGHRIAKIEAKRSNDRYARSLGKSRTGKGFGRGFGRQIRILTTDQGVKGGAMSWWPDDKVRRFVGAKVSDLFDLTDVGFTGWRRVMKDLVEAGVRASPHTWAGTPRPYYCAHLAAGVGNILIVEGIPGTATGMDYSAWQFDEGRLIVPDEPGFGLRLSL